MYTHKKSDENLLRQPVQEIKTTSYRWVILFSFMLSIIGNAVAVATLSPVAIQVQEAYQLRSVTVVNLCAISFPICSVPGTLIAIWAFSKFNVSHVLRLASIV